MFSHAPTLNDFADSIPICQPEADLGSILNIFKHGNCQIIAVPLKNNAWGTISSQDLLSLMAQLWQRDCVSMISHPRIAHQEDISYLTYDNFDYLIKPAIAYQGKIKLQEFLNNLENISLSDCEYLIIDELGKLQGKLETSQILKYLASNLDSTIINTPQISFQPMMADLNTDKFLDNNTSMCWLTLATKASIADSVAIQLADGASATNETLVDKLLGTISHELKSPLTGIVGLSSLFKDRQLGKLNQRQLSYAQLIYQGGQKLMSIVNDLLELTSLTVEKFQPQPAAIDLRFLCLQLFQQAMSKYKSASAAESNFFSETQLKLDIEPGAERAIADKVQLSTILSHLILETLQFCEPAHSILTIKIKSWQECTVIIVNNGLMSDFGLASSTDNFGCPQQSSGLNLVIAQYLAQIAQVKIQSDYSTDVCQLTLLLPQAKTEMSNHSSDTDLAFDTQVKVKKNLTVLCLYPEPEMVDPMIDNYNGLNFNLKNWAEQDCTSISKQHHYQHRVIEADGLEQAHTLARIWKLDVIVLDGHQIADPAQYWRSLQASEYLAALPIVTLDTRTTEAANQIEGLNVYPCLLPADCRSIKELMQVIQIATGLEQ